MAYKYGSKITRTSSGNTRTWRSFLSYSTTTTDTTVSYTVSVGVENCSSASMAFDAKKLNTYLLVDSSTKKQTENSSKLSLNGGAKKTIISSYSGSFTRGSTDTTHTISGKNTASSSCAWHGTSTATLSVNVPAMGKPDLSVKSWRRTQTNAVVVWEFGCEANISYTFNEFPTITAELITGYDADGNPITSGTVIPLTSTSGTPYPTTVAYNERTNYTTTTNSDISSLSLLGDYVITSSWKINGIADYVSTSFIAERYYDRQWSMDFEVSGAGSLSYPDTDSDGYAKNLTLSAFPYENGAFSGTADVIDGRFKVTKVSKDSSTPPQYTWKIHVTLGEEYVNDPLSFTPDAKIKVDWENLTYLVPDADRAFYQTTKNMNYANGLANAVFVGGCNVTNYSSRVWYSQVNNPLYFPDTNYMEVGSNDTSVYGLTKVGDYLCVVKQGKTTDTSIYLAYATSFEDDTTYAVKQGLSGVGADSRYSFNIMNEEALFLSNIGVMAIVPSEDDEKRIQNRSYFIDKKLAEEDHAEAYSFVFGNMYFLVFPTTQHCYVLDGNQRNSWGNDKTNLVYEGYYLEDVPANNFVKYGNSLWFSTDTQLCRFRTDNDAEPYKDGDGGADDTPVVAEWSTVFDDDGSLHYYKTMQKKGNLVSILPTDYKYVAVVITEVEWNEDRKKYFELTEDGYVRCDDESIFNGGNYFVRGQSSTKVYVRKDDAEPVEIERTFNESSNIPSEMMLKKKFKKYKRLQFIIRNEEDEPFGVDEIIKSYTVGNYAKK